MAGYIMTLDSQAALAACAESGVYGTVVGEPNGRWLKHHEGTLADYATMKPGDNIYFFIERMVYGIGELVDVGGACKHINFPTASSPLPADYDAVGPTLLWDEGPTSTGQRWICTFRAAPYFFSQGVDMDDVLSSNPTAFRMLRALWKLSFIKFDDEENQAFRDIILKSNQDVLSAAQVPQDRVFPSNEQSVHQAIAAKVQSGDYLLDAREVMASCANGDALAHEMAVEAGLLHQLATREPDTVGVFGEWDYLSHQVMASPFKPIDYADKMDLFGYAYLPGFWPTRASYLVGEIKRGAGQEFEVDQVMKYVDWVKDEYCHGDYSMIRAFLVAYDFPPDVIAHRDAVAQRVFTLRRRPAITSTWTGLALVRYRFDAGTSMLRFDVV